MIPSTQIENILIQADIVDFIGERIELRRSGATYKAPCPFHDEKTASFHVSEAKQIFKCFGCGVGGNVFNFLMRFEGLNYPEAIKTVAQKLGIEVKEERSKYNYNSSGEITEEDKYFNESKEELVKMMNRAGEYYHNNLLNEFESGENEELLKYLESRNITEKVCKLFKIGYALNGWNNYQNNFKNEKQDLQIEIGLLKKNENGNIYDFFRNRIMFPIYDQLGNISAISARVVNPEDIPKYLNSPESVIYKKNRTLFGLYHSIEGIRKTKQVILVEGNLDFVSMFKYGFLNTVALCGTSFTEEHARLLKRNSREVIIMFDGDKPGKKAAFKTSNVLLNAGLDTKIVDLPINEDPDSYLEKNGTEKLQELISNALSPIDFKIQWEKNEESSSNSSDDDKVKLTRELLESVANISDDLKRNIYLSDVSKKTNIEIHVLNKELTKIIENKKKRNLRQKEIDATRSNNNNSYNTIVKDYIFDVRNENEFSILYLMLTDNTLFESFVKEISESYFKNPEAKFLFLQFYESYEDGDEFNLNKALLRKNDDAFSNFFIDYISKKDIHFGMNFENKDISISNENISFEKQKIEQEKLLSKFKEKLLMAYDDNLLEIKNKLITDKISTLQDNLEELQMKNNDKDILDIMQNIMKLKKKQREIIKG